jgi:hypothetical protein
MFSNWPRPLKDLGCWPFGCVWLVDDVDEVDDDGAAFWVGVNEDVPDVLPTR